MLLWTNTGTFSLRIIIVKYRGELHIHSFNHFKLKFNWWYWYMMTLIYSQETNHYNTHLSFLLDHFGSLVSSSNCRKVELSQVFGRSNHFSISFLSLSSLSSLAIQPQWNEEELHKRRALCQLLLYYDICAFLASFQLYGHSPTSTSKVSDYDFLQVPDIANSYAYFSFRDRLTSLISGIRYKKRQLAISSPSVLGLHPNILTLDT